MHYSGKYVGKGDSFESFKISSPMIVKSSSKGWMHCIAILYVVSSVLGKGSNPSERSMNEKPPLVDAVFEISCKVAY